MTCLWVTEMLKHCICSSQNFCPLQYCWSQPFPCTWSKSGRRLVITLLCVPRQDMKCMFDATTGEDKVSQRRLQSILTLKLLHIFNMMLIQSHNRMRSLLSDITTMPRQMSSLFETFKSIIFLLYWLLNLSHVQYLLSVCNKKQRKGRMAVLFYMYVYGKGIFTIKWACSIIYWNHSKDIPDWKWHHGN